MDVISTTSSTGTVVRVSGDVDTETAPALDVELRRLSEAGVSNLSMDLSGVSFLSSAGLSVLIAAHRDFTSVTVHRGNHLVDRLLGLPGLERLYGHEPSVPIPSSQESPPVQGS